MQILNVTPINWPEPVDPSKEELLPLEFIIEGICARGLVTVIGGAGGSGKSLLAQYLLQKRDGSILPTIRDAYAIYLSGADTSKDELTRRAHAIGKNEGLLSLELPDHALPYICDSSFFTSLKAKLNVCNADVVVFDTLADFHSGNLYDPKEANETMQAFRSLASQANVAVVIITHTRKGSKIKNRYDVEDISDSRIFTTKADIVFGLKSEYQNESSNLIELQCLKSRSSKPLDDLRLTIEEVGEEKRLEISLSQDLFSYEMEDQRKIQAREKNKQWVKQLKEEGNSLRQIEEITGIPKSTVSNLLKES